MPRPKTKQGRKADDNPPATRKHVGFKPMGILVPEAIAAMLKEFADKDDRSVAYMVNRAIREMLERNGYKMPDDKAAKG